MARPIGLPKTGGRTKGIPNKKTTQLVEIHEALGADIPKLIMDLVPQLTPERQMDALLKLMEFLYPKRRSVDIEPTAIQNQVEEKVRIELEIEMQKRHQAEAAKYERLSVTELQTLEAICEKMNATP